MSDTHELNIPSSDEDDSTFVANTDLYTTGGTIPGEGKIYVARRADIELYDNCRSGRLCYVLTARQMGKSSLMVQTHKRLQSDGYRTVVVDLTSGIAGKNVGARQFYFALLTRLEEELELDIEVDEWWDKREGRFSPALLFNNFIRDAVLSTIDESVVMFIDEIDAIRSMKSQGDPFVDDFFATIRAMHNKRATNPEFERITFVLLGVARPNELIDDPERTPFNIGVGIQLSYFSQEEALVLANGMGLSRDKANQVIGWIRDWTGGHPYLTQKMCAAIADNPNDFQNQATIDQLIDELFLSPSEPDSNLRFITDWMTRSSEAFIILKLYYRVFSGVGLSVARSEETIWVEYLKLGGIFQEKNEQLVISNSLYRTFFDRIWLSDRLRENSLITIEELDDVIKDEDIEAEKELHRRKEREEQKKAESEFDLLDDSLFDFDFEDDFTSKSDVGDETQTTISDEELLNHIPDLDRVLAFTDNSKEKFKDIHLEPDEWEVISYINAKNSIQQIAKAYNMSEMDARRVIYNLMQLKLVEIIEPSSKKRPTKSRFGKKVVTAKSPPNQAVVNNLIQRIKAVDDSTPKKEQPSPFNKARPDSSTRKKERIPSFGKPTTYTPSSPSVDTIRILLVDDIVETTESLKKILSFESDIEVVGIASTGREAVKLSETLEPDVILMDINMPDMDGLTATSLITTRFPHIGICMVSVQDDASFMRRAMLAGARDFLTKPVSMNDLYDTIRNIHASIEQDRARMRNVHSEAQALMESVTEQPADSVTSVDSQDLTDEISIIVIDNDAQGRTALQTLLTFEPRFQVVGTVEHGDEGIQLATELEPNIVLINFNLSGIDELEAVSTIRKDSPTSAIIITSMQDDRNDYRQAMKVGASEYLHSPIDTDELYQAIDTVYAKYEPIRKYYAKLAAFDDITLKHVPDLDVVLRFPQTAKEIYEVIVQDDVLTTNEQLVISSIDPLITIRQIADDNEITDKEIRYITYDFIQSGLVEIAKPMEEENSKPSSQFNRYFDAILSLPIIPTLMGFALGMGLILFGQGVISFLGIALCLSLGVMSIAKRMRYEEKDTGSAIGFDTLLDLETALQFESDMRFAEDIQLDTVVRGTDLSNLDNLLQGWNFTQRWRIQLLQADIKLTVAEYLLFKVVMTISLFLAIYLLFYENFSAAVVAGVVGWFTPNLYVSGRIHERLISFNEQLPDSLSLWVNSLRSGYSVLQAMEALAKDAAEPTKGEFTRVVQEVQLGIDLSDALSHLLERVHSEELDMIITAVNIQREVGGNLAEILEIIGATIRERIKASSTPQLRILSVHRYIVVIMGIALILQSTVFAEYFTRIEETNSGNVAMFMAYGLATAVLFFTGWVRQNYYKILGDHKSSWLGKSVGVDILIALGLLAVIVGAGAPAIYTLWFIFIVVTTILFRPQKILPLLIIIIGIIVGVGYASISTRSELPIVDLSMFTVSTDVLLGIVVSATALFLAIFASVWIYRRIQARKSQDPLADRLAQYTNAEYESLEEIELSLSFQERAIIPFVERIADSATRFTPQRQIELTQRNFELAGDTESTPAIFFIQRFALLIIVGVGSAVAGYYVNPIVSIVSFLVGAGIGFYLPLIWLNNKIRTRQERIRNVLPDAIDLMVICVESGLGFDAAMGKVYEKWDNELALDFGRVLREIQLGIVRSDALKAMAKRLEIKDIDTFVASIIQADQLGVSMSRILRVQSDQGRTKRIQRLEAQFIMSQSWNTMVLFALAPASTLWLIAPIIGEILG